MFNVQSSLRPITFTNTNAPPTQLLPGIPYFPPHSTHARPRSCKVSSFKAAGLPVSSSFSRFARGALWLNCLLAYERKVQCSKFNVPLRAFGAKRRKKINNHKKPQEKGTYYKIKSYLCTRKYVCRDSAITAFSVRKSRQNPSRHSQGAVNKHVAFSDHYMLLVFSAGIDCLFRKTPHYLLR